MSASKSAKSAKSVTVSPVAPPIVVPPVAPPIVADVAASPIVADQNAADQGDHDAVNPSADQIDSADQNADGEEITEPEGGPVKPEWARSPDGGEVYAASYLVSGLDWSRAVERRLNRSSAREQAMDNMKIGQVNAIRAVSSALATMTDEAIMLAVLEARARRIEVARAGKTLAEAAPSSRGTTVKVQVHGDKIKGRSGK